VWQLWYVTRLEGRVGICQYPVLVSCRHQLCQCLVLATCIVHDGCTILGCVTLCLAVIQLDVLCCDMLCGAGPPSEE
jgi:hypothetical protein